MDAGEPLGSEMGEFAGEVDGAVLDRLRPVEARVSIDMLMPRLRPAIVFSSVGFAVMFFSAGFQFAHSGGAGALLAPTLMMGMYTYAVVAMLTRRLAVTGGELSRKGFLARTIHVADGDVAGIYLTSAMMPGGMPAPIVLFVGRDNRCLLRLNARAWRRDDIESIGRALATPVEVNDRSFPDASTINEQFPGAFTWSELHSGPLTLAAVGLSVAVIAVFAMVVIGRVH